MTTLKCKVEVDEIVDNLSKVFDYKFEGESEFTLPEMESIPEDFQLGVIVGPSGSGKSSLLKKFGDESDIVWNPDYSVASHFDDHSDAINRLMAVGFNSIPSWMRPYHVLSTGEKFRVDLARRLFDGSVIDEFTSVVDRNVAKSCSVALSRYIRNSNLQNIVLATCHYDVLEWLEPDWIFDTHTGQLSGRGSLRRPDIRLEVLPCSYKAWSLFRQHHYLNHDINRSSRCWIVLWNGIPVGFSAAITFPSGSFKNAWREHRTVVLPDYQGLGIGTKISEIVGEIFLKAGCRFFSKTAHPRMGMYRNNSDRWRPTSKNGISRSDYRHSRNTKEDGHKLKHADRVCYSHEYIGKSS